MKHKVERTGAVLKSEGTKIEGWLDIFWTPAPSCVPQVTVRVGYGKCRVAMLSAQEGSVQVCLHPDNE